MRQEMETIELWDRDAELFGGDLALFWEKRVSIAEGLVIRSDALRLPAAIKILYECRDRYDRVVLGRATKEKPGEG